MSIPVGTCLQCQETREVVKANGYICATMSGGETNEIDYEWPRHRWADWTDKDLARMRILPEFFDLYRRADQWTLQYADCEHIGREHAYGQLEGLPDHICPACWKDTENV